MASTDTFIMLSSAATFTSWQLLGTVVINNWMCFIIMNLLVDNSKMTSGLYTWFYHTSLVEDVVILMIV